MKKHISAVLVLTLVLTTLLAGFTMPALAATSVDFSVTPGVSELLEGDKVKFTFSAENKDAVDLSDCAIYYNGEEQEDIGKIPASSSANGEFTMKVDDSMLGQTLTFKLMSGGANGTEIASATAKVDKKIPSIDLGVSVRADKEIAAAGETVKFTFKLENNGEATASDIVVKAPSLNSGKALKDKFTLEPGKDFSFSYTHTMTSDDLTVKPEITFKANDESQKVTKDIITVTLSKPDVKVELTADNDHPQPGEEVTFTLKIINNGNMSYKHMKVSLNGEEVEFPTSRLKPGDSPSETYKRSFETSAEVSFSITMDNQNDEQKSVTSNAVQIELPVDSSVVNEKVKLNMEVDRPQLTSAGTVNFSGFVTNATEYELLSVQVNETSLGNVYSVSSLEAGGQDAIEWSADINQTTTYNFVMTATDRDGNNYTINAEPITVSVATVEPTPTNFDDAPDVTESGQVLDTGKSSFDASKFFLILAIVLVVLIIGVGVALIVLWKKGKSGGGRPTGGRPSSGRPSSGRPAPRPSSSSPARRPSSGSYGSGPRKPTGTKSYRDRNNF